jgi:hypothetical protein
VAASPQSKKLFGLQDLLEAFDVKSNESEIEIAARIEGEKKESEHRRIVEMEEVTHRRRLDFFVLGLLDSTCLVCFGVILMTRPPDDSSRLAWGTLRENRGNTLGMIRVFCSTLLVAVSVSRTGLKEGMMNVLTEEVIASFKDAARKLTGAKRRAFQAQVTLDYLEGSVCKAERVFGWSHHTVALGLNELRTGITCQGNFVAVHRCCVFSTKDIA